MNAFDTSSEIASNLSDLGQKISQFWSHWVSQIFTYPFMYLGTNTKKPKKLVNIGYLGTGYDVIIGSPHSEKIDPGFRLSVVQLSYNKVSKALLGNFNLNLIIFKYLTLILLKSYQLA